MAWDKRAMSLVLSFSASADDTFTVQPTWGCHNVPVWTHTKTNSANKANSVVHREFYNKGREKKWCTCLLRNLDTTILYILIWFLATGSLSPSDILHGKFCYFSLEILVISKSSSYHYYRWFSCTNTVCNFSTIIVKVQSFVSSN